MPALKKRHSFEHLQRETFYIPKVFTGLTKKITTSNDNSPSGLFSAML